MSMFSSFFKSKPKPTAAEAEAAEMAKTIMKSEPVERQSEEQGNPVEIPPEFETYNFDVYSEPGGGRGWPTDVSLVFYHKTQGLIIVGTQGGAIYAYGDGFQFLRPWLSEDPSAVISIAAPTKDAIVVAFEDNSIAVLALPSLTVVDLLEPFWLRPEAGTISTISCDEVSADSYAYVGTSQGYVFVLQINVKSVRICEFSLAWTDAGLTQPMAITEMQISPRPEKYFAIAYSTLAKDSGTLVVYSLNKLKVKYTFTLESIMCVTFDHTGDMLYIGTRNGKILSLNLAEKGKNLVPLWDTSQETIDPIKPVVRKLTWLPAQRDHPNDSGCLFALLKAGDNSSDLSLKTSIIGLSPVNAQSPEVEVIFSLAANPLESVLGFRLVPTLDQEDDHNHSGVLGAKPVPSLLLLTQDNSAMVNEEDFELETERDKQMKRATVAMGEATKSSKAEAVKWRQLKTMQLPSSSMSDWQLESAILPPAKLATEVLPANVPVTAIHAYLPPRLEYSFSYILLHTASSKGFVSEAVHKEYIPRDRKLSTIDSDGEDEDDDDDDDDDEMHSSTVPQARVRSQSGAKTNSRSPSKKKYLRPSVSRCSTSGYLKSFMGDDDESMFDVVLAGVVGDDFEALKENAQDILLMGHTDGSIVPWGVYMPESGLEAGRENKLVPLGNLECGNSEVSVFASDDSKGIMAAGNVKGSVFIWEVYEKKGDNKGAIEHLRTVKKGMLDPSAANTRHGSIDQSDEVAETVSDMRTFSISLEFRPAAIREAVHMSLGGRITALLVEGSITTLMAGTEDGMVFISSDMSAETVMPVDVERVGDERGAVTGFHYSFFSVSGDMIPAMYVTFEEGQVAVISMLTISMIAYTNQTFSEEIINRQSSFDAADMDAEAEAGKLNNQRTPTVAVSCVTHFNGQILPKPELGDCIARESVAEAEAPELDSGAPPISASSSLAPDRKKSFTMFNAKSETRMASNSDVVASKQMKSNLRIDNKTFNVLFGQAVVLYDLSKFVLLMNSPKPLRNGLPGAIRTNVISSYNIVGGTIVQYVEEAERAWTKPSPFFSMIDSNGSATIVSVASKQHVCNADMLNGIVEEPLQCQLNNCVMLASGNCYMLQSGHALHCASIKCKTHILSEPLPKRIRTRTCTPSTYMLLATGRDKPKQQEVKVETKQRKRSIFAGVTSAMSTSNDPVDLDKVFSKVKIPLNKEKLMSGAVVQEQDPDSKAYEATQAVLKAKSEAQELGEALAKRGEKLTDIEQKMEDFKNNAQEFRRMAAANKKKLQARDKALSFW